jgi:hypothetical protein
LFEGMADSYTPRHALVHVTADVFGTVSLILRGPTMKKPALRTDLGSGKVWYGVEQHRRVCDELKKVGLLRPAMSGGPRS